MENYIIKNKARNQLKSNRELVIGTIFLSTVLLSLANVMLQIDESGFVIFTLIFTLGYLFLSAPIQAGRCRFLLNITQEDKEARVTDLFSQFSVFLKVFSMNLIIIILQVIITFIPIVLSEFIGNSMSISDFTINMTPLETIVLGIITLISSIAVLMIEIMYSQNFYIVVEEPNLSIIECMRKSRKLMKGNKFKYFKLQFSFIGWWMLSILTLGVASLWVTPYTMLANTNFYEQLKDHNK